MRNKQLLIVVVTLIFYSLNPTMYDEKLEMEEDDKHIARVTHMHCTFIQKL